MDELLPTQKGEVDGCATILTESFTVTGGVFVVVAVQPAYDVINV